MLDHNPDPGTDTAHSDADQVTLDLVREVMDSPPWKLRAWADMVVLNHENDPPALEFAGYLRKRADKVEGLEAWSKVQGPM